MSVVIAHKTCELLCLRGGNKERDWTTSSRSAADKVGGADSHSEVSDTRVRRTRPKTRPGAAMHRCGKMARHDLLNAFNEVLQRKVDHREWQDATDR